MNHRYNQNTITKTIGLGERARKSPSATTRQAVDVSSRSPRDLVEHRSKGFRQLFGSCSSIVRVAPEAHPNNTRANSEVVPSQSRSRVEALPKVLRIAPEEKDIFFARFFGRLKARIKYRSSKDIVLFSQQLLKIAYRYESYFIRKSSVEDGLASEPTTLEPKNDLRITQQRPKDDPILTQETAKDDTRKRVGTWKNKAIPLMAVWLCFMLFNLSEAWAQSAESRAAEGQSEIKPLQVGDTIPEEVWDMPLQVVNHPTGRDTIALNDYRDKKLIILDFWATWCGACIASFPRMHDLEIEMADKVKILPITTQSDSVVRNFLDRGSSPHLEALKEHFYSAVNAKYLKQLFRSASIPHVVVIDQRGVVRARTTPSVLSFSNLLDIAENPFSAPIPMAIEEITSPLMKPTFGERDRQMYYSGLYPFSHTLPYIQHTNVDSLKGITQFFYTNAPVIQLFSAALKYAPDYVNGLARIPSRRIFEVSQPERFDDRLSDENLDNWYAYESVNLLGTADEVIRKRMIDDLEFYLGLEAGYEERNVKCLVLRIANLADVPVNKDIGSASQLVIDGRTRGDGTPDGRFEQDATSKKMPSSSYAYNFKLDRLAYTLNRTMRLGMPYIIDETGLGDPVNLVLPDNLSNIEDLQRMLSEQGLRLDYENRKLTMFVLKEKDYTPSGKDMVMKTFGYVYGNGKEGVE